MTAEGWQQLNAFVLARPEVLRTLDEATTDAELCQRLIEIATNNGYAVSTADIDAAVAAARRAWQLRAV